MSRLLIISLVVLAILALSVPSVEAHGRKFGSKLDAALQAKRQHSQTLVDHQKKGMSDKVKNAWEAAKKKFSNIKATITKGIVTLKDKFTKATAPASGQECANADNLYALICPDEQTVATAYGKFFDQPPGAGLSDQGAMDKLSQWWTANKDAVKGKMSANINAFVGTLGGVDATEKKAITDSAATFTVGDDLSDATLVGAGFVMLAFAEANAASPAPGMAKPKYLEFALTHENGHMLDPEVINDGSAAAKAQAKAFPNRNAFNTINAGWGKEIFADYVAAYATKSYSKAEIIEALTPFCGGSGGGAQYPPMKQRIMLIARSGAYYPTLCGTNNGARGTSGTDYVATFP